MALKSYHVQINGIPHVLELDADDAARLGDAAVPVEAAEPKARKASTKAAPKPANKAADGASEEEAPASDDTDW